MLDQDLFVNQRYEPEYPIGKPQPHPQNPKTHDDAAIASSIEANGFYGAILVQESTDYVLAGHGRLDNLRAAGATTVPTFIIDCDDDTAMKILLSDNITGLKGGFNEELLADMLKEMSEAGDLFGTGYDADDVDALLSKFDAPLPEAEFGGGYVEDEEEAKHRAERVATTKQSLGLREVVLVYQDDDYEQLKQAVAVVSEFHSADSTSAAVLAALVNYAKELADT